MYNLCVYHYSPEKLRTVEEYGDETTFKGLKNIFML